MKPPKYTAEQINEIIGRIVTLRKRWLSVVETQLASRLSGLGVGRAGLWVPLSIWAPNTLKSLSFIHI